MARVRLLGFMLVLSLVATGVARRVSRLAASSRVLTAYFPQSRRRATAGSPVQAARSVDAGSLTPGCVPRAVAADELLITHVERKLCSALSSALGTTQLAQPPSLEALDGAARALAEQLAQVAAHWHGPATSEPGSAALGTAHAELVRAWASDRAVTQRRPVEADKSARSASSVLASGDSAAGAAAVSLPGVIAAADAATATAPPRSVAEQVTSPVSLPFEFEPSLANRRLADLCELARERIERMPAADLLALIRLLAAAPPALGQPGAPAEHGDAPSQPRDPPTQDRPALAFVRAAATARFAHRVAALWTYDTIQAQHRNLRSGPGPHPGSAAAGAHPGSDPMPLNPTKLNPGWDAERGGSPAPDHSERGGSPAPDHWEAATHEPRSLRSYAAAAEQMGERAWVRHGFEWCAERAEDFFFKSGWRKLALRPERVPAWHVPHAAGRPYPEATRACFAARVDAPRDPPPAEWRRRRLRLCDVGSCYNPFSAPQYADLFDVTALDLWPAAESAGVLRCDFLSVELLPEREDEATEPVGARGASGASAAAAGTVAGEEDGAEASGGAGDQGGGSGGAATAHDALAGGGAVRVGSYTAADGSVLPAATALVCGAFDVVVISLVLSYLPLAEQRAEMVRRARALLRKPTAAEPHRAGLLLIVDAPSVSRPGDNRGARARPDTALSQWIVAAEGLGLRYVRHDLLQRDAHALAFQTVPGPTPAAGSPQVLPFPIRRELVPPVPVPRPVAAPPRASAADGAVGGAAGPQSDGESDAAEEARMDERLRWLPDLLLGNAA